MDIQHILNDLLAPTSGTKTPSISVPLPPRTMSKNPFRNYQVDPNDLPDQLYHVGPNVGLGGCPTKAPSQQMPQNIKQSVNDHRSSTGSKSNDCWISVYPDRKKADEEADKQSIFGGKVHVVFVVDSTQLGSVIEVPVDGGHGSELLVFGEIPEKAFISSVKTLPTASPEKAVKDAVEEEFFDAEDGNDELAPSPKRSSALRFQAGGTSKGKKQAAPAISNAKETSRSIRTPKNSKVYLQLKERKRAGNSGNDDSHNSSVDEAIAEAIAPPKKASKAKGPIANILFDEADREFDDNLGVEEQGYLIEWNSDKDGKWIHSWEAERDGLVKRKLIDEYEKNKTIWVENAKKNEKKEQNAVLFKERRKKDGEKRVMYLVDWTTDVAPSWKLAKDVERELKAEYRNLEHEWKNAKEKRDA